MAFEMCKPKMFVAYTWITIVVLLFIYGICAIALAVENDSGDESDNQAIGFAGIFTMILSFALAVGGTLVMRKYQTELAVGFFLGVVIMMSFNFLTLTALLAYEYNECDDANHRVEDGTANCYFEGCSRVEMPDPSVCYDTGENWDPVGGAPASCFEDEHISCCSAFRPRNLDPNQVIAPNEQLPNTSTFAFVQSDCIVCTTGNCDANLAGAVFSCFLFVAYAIFGAILGVYKSEIVTKPSAGETEDATAEPPSMQ
jgi:hypothetical protein